MITKDNFKDVLVHLGFTQDESKNQYKKQYTDCEIAVDFENEKLIYPKGITIHDHTTSNFEHNENFVVFECVCHLLNKGYRAEHMELEPRWQVGHNASGGKADILVRDDNGDSYIIIECKTSGREYNKEKKNTEADGGQLFSYWQQVTSTKWLALYASDWDTQNKKITYTSDVIHSEDDPNILKLAEKDASILTYRKAHNNKERFSVWDETYNKTWLNNTIFDAESQAYKVGVPPLRKGKLKDFADAKSIVNKFEEILRHNNVSDKENAFNKLVALFICKLVDEIKKSDDDIVEFQYKQGADTYESLQDRLQRLHKQGMDEFMQEELFYVEADYADKLFQQYTGQKRKKAIAELNETIRKLKFYTNNDFAFKDVHNEGLFYQNGKILVEVVQLFQPYRIVFSSKNQVLGDLFEGLLNKGFKQSEGQFFTPMPITRFMWDSLPLRGYVSKHGLPRMIDYACGAAHFLIDGVEAIIAVANIDRLGDVIDNKWVKDCVFGIEKDYRLARVSKVSMFMNGAGDTNIIFGDGLENYHDKGVKAGTFDILVANPPYSVKGFKQHLALKNNTFELLQAITNDGGEIETLFVERIAQLLQTQGIAAVILPASMLNNDSSSYMGAREQLLKNFHIHAIVSLGKKTFGATSTSTIILFLERYNEPPRMANLVNDSVDAIMNGMVNTEFSDSEVLLAYVNHQGVTCEEYMRFLARDMSHEEISAHPYFKAYNTIDVKVPSKATAEEALSLRKEKFYDNALAIEREKLYYFAIVYKQRTLVISAPSDNDKQEQFLGYTWSNRRGNEGIVITSPGGKLYDDKDRYKEGTLASAVRKRFDGVEETLSDELQEYAKTYWLKDMMDFSREKFTKEISTTARKSLEVKSKYPIKKISELVYINEKTINPQDTPNKEYIYIDISSIESGTGKINYDNIIKGVDAPSRARRYAPADSVLISTVRPNLRAFAFVSKEIKNAVYSTGFAILRAKDNTILLNKYLYINFMCLKPLMSQMIDKMPKGQYPSINRSDIESLQIPLPPIEIQQKIVEECEAIDEEYNRTRMSIEEYQHKINDIFTSLEVISEGGRKLRLSDSEWFDISIGRRVTSDMMSDDYDIPVYSANVFEPFGKINKQLLTDYSKDSVLWGVDGDWMVTVIEHDIPFYPTDHCGVIRIKTDELLPKVLCHLLRKEGERMKFSRSNRASTDRVRALNIIVPPIAQQQEAVAAVEAYEAKIREARAVMDGCDAQCRAVLDKYLELS